MPERVAVGRIIVGHGDERKTIEPGERFHSQHHEISDEDLERMDVSGIVRRPRDQRRQPAAAAAEPEADDAPADAGKSGRGRRKAKDLDDDEL